MASTWYVSPNGSNGNSGTSLDFPWATFAYAASNSASGDTIVAVGGRYGSSASDVFVKSCSNLRIVGYSAASPPILSTGRYATTWTLDSGNCWYSSIGTGKNVAGVAIKWGLLTDGYGRYTSDAAIAASVVACRAANNSYYYDSAAGRLYVNFAGANPNSDVDILAYPTQWFEGGIESLIALTGDDNTIEGLVFENQRDITIDSFGIIAYGNRNIIQGNTLRHMAWHGIVTAGSAGASNTDCIIRQNTLVGGGNTIARGNAILVASYADSGSGLNLSGLRVSDNVVKCYPPLLVSGSVASAATCSGFYQHTDSVAKVASATYRNNSVTHYENAGDGFTGGDTLQSAIPAAGSAAELAWQNYPIQYINNTQTGGFQSALIDGGAYVKCSFFMPGSLGTNAANFYPPASLCRTLFDSCHVAANLYSAAGYRAFVQLYRTSGAATFLNLVNTTLLDVASSTPSWNRGFSWIGAANDDGKIRAYGCAIASLHAKALTLNYGDNGMSASKFQFVGCYYYNIESGAGGYWSEDPTRNELADWQAIDPVGPAVYSSTDPGFVSPSTSTALTVGGNLDTTKVRQTIHTTSGINNRPYDGHFGAIQKGGGGVVGTMMQLGLLGAGPTTRAPGRRRKR